MVGAKHSFFEALDSLCLFVMEPGNGGYGIGSYHHLRLGNCSRQPSASSLDAHYKGWHGFYPAPLTIHLLVVSPYTAEHLLPT